MTTLSPNHPLTLPDALLSDDYWSQHRSGPQKSCALVVPKDYLERIATNKNFIEILAIQRLIALANTTTSLHVEWDVNIAQIVARSPSIFPLLAVLILLQGASHFTSEQKPFDPNPSRNEIYRYRAKADLFSESQIIVCDDSRGRGRPIDLYDTQTRGLRRKEDLETLVINVLTGLLPPNHPSTATHRLALALGVVVSELFENTDMHGKLDANGSPIRPNALRGIIFKRLEISDAKPKAPEPNLAHSLDCLEISVFDSGIGYYQSMTKKPITSQTSLDEEWAVVHKCLQRHYDDSIPDGRAAHRAMGLYEVLRAIDAVSGQFEVRTGRVHGYRTFLPGNLRVQMEPQNSLRPGMPKPRLMDMDKKFVAIPTLHEEIGGTAIRVIVPLA